MGELLIRNGRVLDPHASFDAICDVLIRDGVVAGVGSVPADDSAEVIDATGLIVAPGFIDLHCHLREPGFEYKETIASGTQAALRGGFTTVCAMSNTEPPSDTRATVEYVLGAAVSTGARVLPIGCVTKGRKGVALTEMSELAEAGCIAFSDDGAPVVDGQIMRRALEYAKLTGLTVIDHCEDPNIALQGVMHEGPVSTRLGLRGQPAAAEESFVARDLALCELTKAPLHIAHVSTRGSVQLIREAKERGVPVTAEVTPHHLTLTAHDVAFSAGADTGLAYDTNAKVNPPLRTADDVAACVEGLRDGVIDAIATDHAPHAAYEKNVEFDGAPFGISGLETALGLCMSLVHSGQLSLPTLIERLTFGPTRAFRLDEKVPGLGTLAVGAPADVVIFDPDLEWAVEPEHFASKGKNTPLAGRKLQGGIATTVSAGRVRWTMERVVA